MFYIFWTKGNSAQSIKKYTVFAQYHFPSSKNGKLRSFCNTPFIPVFCLRKIESLLRLSLKHPPGYSKGLLIQLTPTSLTSEPVAVCTIYVIPSKLIKETKSVNTVLVVQIVWLSFCPVMEV